MPLAAIFASLSLPHVALGGGIVGTFWIAYALFGRSIKGTSRLSNSILSRAEREWNLLGKVHDAQIQANKEMLVRQQHDLDEAKAMALRQQEKFADDLAIERTERATITRLYEQALKDLSSVRDQHLQAIQEIGKLREENAALKAEIGKLISQIDGKSNQVRPSAADAR